MTIDSDASARISLLRFPLIVGVVFGHAFGSNVGLAYGKVGLAQLTGLSFVIQYYISEILAPVTVPLFYFMSGFLFFESFDGSFNKYYNKLKSRFRTLLIPFIFWNLLTLLIVALAHAGSTSSMYLSGRFASISSFSAYDYLNKTFGFTCYPAAYQFWFIRDLMIMVVFSPLIYVLIRHIPRLTLFVLLIVWIFDLSHLYTPSSESILFFFIGGLTGSRTSRLDGFDKYGKVLFYSYALISIIDVFTRKFGYNRYIHSIGIILGIIVAIWLAGVISKSYNKISKLLMMLGATSFFVYAFHEPLLTIIKKLVYVIFTPSSSTSVSFFYFIDPTITILLCVILYFIGKKITPSFMRVVCGGR
jgi:surface polysaccharide O-acyltransferase-like enzyme